MSEPDCTVSLKPSSLMRGEARRFAFEKKSVSSVQGVPGHSIPLRVAVIGTTSLDSVEFPPSRQTCVTRLRLSTERWSIRSSSQ